jgi:hypothetical protein
VVSGLLPACVHRAGLASDLRDRRAAGRPGTDHALGRAGGAGWLLVGASLMIRACGCRPRRRFVDEALLTLRFYVAGDSYDPVESEPRCCEPTAPRACP